MSFRERREYQCPGNNMAIIFSYKNSMILFFRRKIEKVKIKKLKKYGSYNYIGYGNLAFITFIISG